MKTMPGRSFLSFMPRYNQNAVIQLIAANGVGYLLFQFTKVFIMALGRRDALTTLLPNIALPELHLFATKWWTIFSYGWVHLGFWEWLSNMVWLYCFGNVIQMLVGYKQIIPLFIYSLLLGGGVYMACQNIPYAALHTQPYLMGAQAGVMGLCMAALKLAPKYRFYLNDYYSVPMVVVVGIFVVLNLLYVQEQMARVFLLAGGGLAGFVYIRLLRVGYRPGEWIYDIYGRIENLVTPSDSGLWQKQGKKRNQILSKMSNPKQNNNQQKIDDILDKINQKGYDSLTEEEKETLLRASKEKD